MTFGVRCPLLDPRRSYRTSDRSGPLLGPTARAAGHRTVGAEQLVAGMVSHFLNMRGCTLEVVVTVGQSVARLSTILLSYSYTENGLEI